MASGFEIIRSQLFTGANGDRANVPNQLIVISDGNSNIRQPDTIPEVDLCLKYILFHEINCKV